MLHAARQGKIEGQGQLSNVPVLKSGVKRPDVVNIGLLFKWVRPGTVKESSTGIWVCNNSSSDVADVDSPCCVADSTWRGKLKVATKIAWGEWGSRSHLRRP